MEILIGIMLAGVTEIMKELRARFGKETATRIIYAFTFIAALVYATLQYYGIFNSQTWKIAVEIFSAAIATYEVIIKRFIQPVVGYKE